MTPRRLPLLPLLLPATWRGGEGNECCRRLFGGATPPEHDPWVALTMTTETGYQVLAPGSIGLLREAMGAPFDLPQLEGMACGNLAELLAEAKPGLTFPQPDFGKLVVEDLAASAILLPELLRSVQARFASPCVFVTIPTRATIFFAGTPAGAMALASITRAVQAKAPAADQLSGGLFIADDGVLRPMGDDVPVVG